VGPWQEARTQNLAYEYNCGLLAFQLETPAERRKILPERVSFIEVTPSNIVLSALKKAEGIDSVIVRLYETAGIPTRARISLFHSFQTSEPLIRQPKSVRRVDLLERDMPGEVDFSPGAVSLNFKPFEIVSLRLAY
jgi:alpha-mannosidase